MSPSPCWAVSDTNKLNSCSLQLFLSTMQRSFFFSSLKIGLWDFLNKYSASSPEQNGSESKTAGFWICSVPLFFYVTSSKSIMIGIKSKLEGTVLKPRTTFTFLRGWSMKIQWQIHFSYAELWLWRICKDRRGQRWELSYREHSTPFKATKGPQNRTKSYKIPQHIFCRNRSTDTHKVTK